MICHVALPHTSTGKRSKNSVPSCVFGMCEASRPAQPERRVRAGTVFTSPLCLGTEHSLVESSWYLDANKLLGTTAMGGERMTHPGSGSGGLGKEGFWGSGPFAQSGARHPTGAWEVFAD